MLKMHNFTIRNYFIKTKAAKFHSVQSTNPGLLILSSSYLITSPLKTEEALAE